MAQKKNAKKQKVSAKQQEAKIEKARQRQAEAEARKQRKDTLKRIGIAIVAVILILGLSIPTIGLSVLAH